MSATGWYYAQGSQQMGPVGEDDVSLLIERGTIGPDTLVWREGMPGWAAARTSLPGAMIPQRWVDGLSASVAPLRPDFERVPEASYRDEAGAGAYHHPTQLADVVRTVFSRYVLFRGRARRAEYWYWILFVVLVSIGLALIDGAIFGFDTGDAAILGPVFSLATFLPSLGLAFRRMHDTGRSAWWLLLGLIPIIGSLVLIWWFAQRGDEGANQYGPA